MLVEWKTVRFNEYRKVSTQKFYATEICILVDFAEKVNITDQCFELLDVLHLKTKDVMVHYGKPTIVMTELL